jgi:hypothetical protein
MSPRDAVLISETSGVSWPTEVKGPHCLFPQCLVRADGTGSVIDVSDLRGKLTVVTMSINHVAEHEWLALTVWGSVDGIEWGTKPLVTLSRKDYCGVYSTFLDLARHKVVRYLQVRWTMACWGKGDGEPVFGFSVSVQEAGS